ncbi:MAG TPA: carbohydrate kinase [Pyrinomonadaceae bacterium]|nr:carbohydrate kinase [Pyrinomonadaceae bacterium]
MKNESVNRRTIIGIGEALWDLLPAGRHLGGAPLNFTYISSLLGQHAIALSRIGNDKPGKELKQQLQGKGVDTTYIQTDSLLPTGTAAVTVAADGQGEFEISQPAAWDALDLTAEWKELARQADAVCFGTLGQRSMASRTTIQGFLRETRQDCIRVFDVNLRAPFYSREVILDSLALATIAKFNEAEFAEVVSITGLAETTGSSLKAFAARFDLGLVCITRGARGSILATRDRVLEHAGFATDVRDTVGAGDAFTAALTHAWLRGADLKEISTVANCWAAWVASQTGAMPFYNAEPKRRAW